MTTYRIDVQSALTRLRMARLWLAKTDDNADAGRHALARLAHEFDDIAFQLAGPDSDDLTLDVAYAYHECQRLAQRSCCREDFVRRLESLGWDLTSVLSGDNADTLPDFYAQMDWPNGEADFWGPR